MSKKPTISGIGQGSKIPVSFGSSAPRSILPTSTKLTKEKKSSAIHSSMEDIHRPKNYRERRLILTKEELKVAGAGDYGSGISGSLTPVTSRTPRSGQGHKKLLVASKDHGQSSALVPIGVPVSDDNAALYQYIKEEKKKALVRRAVQSFVYGALKRKANEYERLDEIRKTLSLQLAARKVQQCLLLASWRKQREEMEKLSQDHAQLTVAVENLEVQIRVSKHLHASERERVLEYENELQGMKKQFSTAEKSLKICEGELSSIKEELRFVTEDREKLAEHKTFLIKEVTILKEEKQSLVYELEKCRSEAQEAELELKQSKSQIMELKRQVKDLTMQCNQWQEKNKDLEAEGWEMKLNLEKKNQAINDVKLKLKTLKKDYEVEADKKKSFQDAYFELSESLKASFESNRSLHEELVKKAEANEEQVKKLMDLERDKEQLEIENTEIQNELKIYKLKYLRRRRSLLMAFGQISVFGVLRLLFGLEPGKIEVPVELM